MEPSQGQKPLVLASGSPRRRELLSQCGLVFDVDAANVDETPRLDEFPRVYVERLARDKAAATFARRPDALVLAADTSVILEDEILGKPRDVEDAERMLARLSGHEHWVMTGVALARGNADFTSTVVKTRVIFRKLERTEISWYARTGEPLDKAGAYAIQGVGAFCIRSVEGSVSNVIGLPLVETLELLRDAGLRLPWTAP